MKLFGWIKRDKSSKKQISSKQRLKVRTLKKLSRVASSKKYLGLKFDRIVYDFFRSFFGIKYEFTYHEVVRLIKKKRLNDDLKAKLDIFCGALENAKFNDGAISDDEYKALVDGFREIVSSL